MPQKTKVKKGKKTQKSAVTVKTNNALVNKFTLQKKKFASKNDVQEFLDERGFGDFSITEDGDNFVATTTKAYKSDEELKTVVYPEPAYKDAVTIEVAKSVEIEVIDEEAKKEDSSENSKKSEGEDGEGESGQEPEATAAEDSTEGESGDEEPSEPGEGEEPSGDDEGKESEPAGDSEEDVEKAKNETKEKDKYNSKKFFNDEKLVSKFNWYAAAGNDPTSFKEAFANGFDGFAAGTYEMVDLLAETIRNNVTGDDLDGVSKSIDEFKEVVIGICSAIKDLNGVTKSEVVKAMFNKDLLDSTVESATAKASKAAKEQEETKKSALDLASKEDLELLISNVAKDVIGAALKPIQEKLDSTSKALEEQKSTATESAKSAESLQEELKTIKTSVSKLSKVRPAMKSFDAFEEDYSEDSDELSAEQKAKKSALKNLENSLVM